MMAWKVFLAWVVKIEAGPFKSTGTDIALESVEFACESVAIEILGVGVPCSTSPVSICPSSARTSCWPSTG